MKKDKYSFRDKSIDLARMVDENPKAKIIKFYKRGQKPGYLITVQMSNIIFGHWTFAGLPFYHNGVQYRISANPKVVEQIDQYIKDEEAKSWYDIYTWS